MTVPPRLDFTKGDPLDAVGAPETFSNNPQTDQSDHFNH